MALKFLNNGYFAGKVGIGKLVPTKELDVVGDAKVLGTLTVETSNNNIRLLDSNDSSVNFSVGVNGKFQVRDVAAATSPFEIEKAAPSDSLYIDSAGNVGIGTDNPIVPLHVSGAAVNDPSNGTGGYEVMQIFDTTSYATGVGGGIGFGGNFTSNNNTIFSEIRGLKENATDNNYAGALSFSTRLNGGNITERMRIDSSGYTKFTKSTGGIIASFYDGTYGVDLAATATGGSIQTFNTNQTLNFNTYGTGDITFTTSNNSERMRITSAGGISFGSTGTAYGTSGQVLTSAGNASPTWTTPTTGTVTGTGTTGRLTKFTDGANGVIGNSGIQDASNAIAITINGNEEVGINKTNPTRPLHVGGIAQIDNGSLQLGGTSSVTGTNPQLRRTNSSNDLAISTGGSDRITVLGAGNVGIGTTSPDNLLTIESSGDTILQINRNDNTIGGGNRTGIIQFGAKGTWGTNLATSKIWSYAEETFTSTANGTSLRFFTTELGAAAPTEKMIIDTNGNVGIGTDNPVAKLHVNAGTSNTVGYFESTDARSRIVLKDNSGEVHLNAIGDNITFETSALGTERMRITSAGNVGIGTTNPVAALNIGNNGNIRIDGNGSGGGIYASSNGSNNTFSLTRQDGVNVGDLSISGYSGVGITGGRGSSPATSGYSFYVKSDGNVGIGTTSPGVKLDVNGESVRVINANPKYYLNNSVVQWHTTIATNDYRIHDGIDDRLTIKRSSGNVGIGTTSPVSLLHIKGADPVFTIQDTSTGTAQASSTLRLGESGSGGVLDVYWDIKQASDILNTHLEINHSANGNALTILDNKNVGIGTTSPSAKLHVVGTGLFTGLVSGITPVAAANFVTKAYVDGSGGGTGPFLPLAGGTLSGPGNLTVGGTLSVTGITTLNGQANVGSVVPRIDSTFSLGSNTLRFASIYGDGLTITNNATFGGNVNIGSTTSSSTVLNLIKSTSGVAEIKFLNVNNEKASIQLDAAEDLQIFANASQQIKLRSGGADALTLDTSQNATFTGNVTAPTFIGNVTGNLTGIVTSTSSLADGVTGTTQGDSDDSELIATTAFVQNLIETIPAGLVFQGTWNAATNTPTLTSGTGTTGNFYIVSVAGSTNLDGITDWQVGDWAVFVEVGITDAWQKIDNSSVLDGFGTGQTMPLWSGSGTSNTLTDSNITQDANLITRFGKTATTATAVASINHASNDFLYINGGTAGASFGDDNQNTRVICYNNDYIRFDTTSSERMRIADTLITYPTVTELRGDVAAKFAIGNMGGASSQMMVSSRGFLTFNVSNTGSALDATERMRITSAGELQVTGNGVIRNEHSSANYSYWQQTASDARLFTQYAQPLYFGTNASTKMTILSGGNVGIGTTAPGSPLEIEFAEDTGTTKEMLHLDYNPVDNYGSALFKISSGSSANNIFEIEQVTGGGAGDFGTYVDTNIINRNVSSGAYGNINFVTGSSTSASSIVMTIGGGTQKGNVGIGTTDPDEKLVLYKPINYNSDSALFSAYAVNSTAVNNNQVFKWRTGITGNATGHNLCFQTLSRTESSYVERMRITSAGAIKFNNYNSTNNTGTPTYLLGTDASGNVVKTLTTPSPITSQAASLYDLIPNGAFTTTYAFTSTAGTYAEVMSGDDVITAAGTYSVQMYVSDYAVGGTQYREYYSGVMSWNYPDNTNDTGIGAISEIVLHRAGHAANQGITYLRTRETGAAGNNELKLEIMCNRTYTGASNVVFKFVRLI